MENLVQKVSLMAVIQSQGFQWDWDETGEWDSPYSYQDGADGALADRYMVLLQLGFREIPPGWSVSLTFLASMARRYVQALAQTENLEELRGSARVPLNQSTLHEILSSRPYMIGQHYVTEQWVKNLWNSLHDAFVRDIEAFDGSVAAYFREKNADIFPLGRIYFHLVESKDDKAPFAFLATFMPDKTQARRQLPLKNALATWQDTPGYMLELLSPVARVAQESAWIRSLLDTGEIYHPLRLSAEEAYTFFKEIPLYERSGILCRIPKWWTSRRHRVRVQVDMPGELKGLVGTHAILDFHVNLVLDGEPLSLEEVEHLRDQTEGLANIKGKWVEVDPKEVQRVLSVYEKMRRRGPRISVLDALKLELYQRADEEPSSELPQVVEISHAHWLDELLRRKTVPLDTADDWQTGVKATLRPYQIEGVRWLLSMHRLGLGACLADDMGLGKTLQVLAVLSALRQTGPLRALLVVPASLLGNWRQEAEKFTPHLTVRTAHPSAMKVEDLSNPQWLSGTDMVLTTYSLVGKYEWMRETPWSVMVLDEAQAIKNAGTQQARAVKQVQATFRMALTGTPIENRLSDLWSLFDFLNRGLLGTQKEFRTYLTSLRAHPQGYGPLRDMVSPFILRRMKTDPKVIDDLPAKIEMPLYAELTRQQAMLYQEVVNHISKSLDRTEGIERQGLILASLLKLKQILNHPDQYLGQYAFDPDQSGKFQRLAEVAGMIYSQRERVLVFTQFREMTKPLAEFLTGIFHHPGLVLHGGTPVLERQKMVAKFQDEPYVPFLVASLKVGGVGLNLTRANHVIHFDRWWNPAVENQATDRAFRIGQKKTVMVHKMVTHGTIEEKIDRLIAEKSELSRQVIANQSEQWIGDLDNDSLRRLLRFDQEV